MLNETISRRALIKGAASLAALVGMTGALAACSGEAEPAEDEGSAAPAAEAGSSAADSEAAATPAAAGAALVAYFSATGNTENVANLIAEHLGADMFAITPQEPYTADDLDYNDSSSRTSTERADANRSVTLAQVTPEGFEGYDTVFVGYPIWWGDASWVVDGFVAGNDFTGKTVVPFCTSASSGIGSSGERLAELAGTGTWLDGERFSGGATQDEVASWVDGLAL